MASRYAGLKHWQWAIVLVISIVNAFASSVGGLPSLVGAFVGTFVSMWLLAIALAYAVGWMRKSGAESATAD